MYTTMTQSQIHSWISGKLDFSFVSGKGKGGRGRYKNGGKEGMEKRRKGRDRKGSWQV